MKRKPQNLKRTASRRGESSQVSELPTFLDHVYELRRRIFWVVAVILVASGAAYPFLDKVISVLTAPLGNQQLYYLTPVGGMSFSIKLCMYIGIMVAVPVIMYHLYRFLEPLMGQWRKSALFYVGLSSSFAIMGILFAYFFSLPGALHFLTGLNLNHIQAMLTVDSYLTFVMTYLLGAALLFQIPLLLLIINTMTPLKPSKLMKFQRYVIVIAFILAAVISPTPDILNQIIFALPMIVMYQVGILLVWAQNRRRANKQAVGLTRQVLTVEQPASVLQAPAISNKTNALLHPTLAELQPKHMQVSMPHRPSMQTAKMPMQPQAVIRRPDVRTTDGMMRAPNKALSRPVAVNVPQSRVIKVPTRTVDGFVQYRSSTISSS